MKIKHSLKIGGQDYTDRLISVSTIDTGVRGFGYGYISDITVDCAYTSSLLDATGQTAEVGLLLGTVSVVYQGSVERVSLQGRTLSITIAPKRPDELFKPRERIYVAGYKKHIAIPVVYGNGTCKAELLVVEKKAGGVYKYLVGDNPDTFGVYQDGNAYFYETMLFLQKDPVQWGKLPDGTPVWDISRYGSDRYLQIHRVCHSKYGVKEDGNGNLVEEFLGNDTTILIQGGQYKWIKFIPISGCSSDGWNDIKVYEYRDLTPDTQITFHGLVSPLSISSASDIIVDILKRNGISYTVPYNGFFNINLTFRADESFRDIVQKVAEQGLVHIVPTHNNFRIVPAVFSFYSFSPVYTFTNSVILPQSLSIEKTLSPFNKLTTIYNQEENTYQFGSGSPEKEYKADYIIDFDSAEAFTIGYLRYHQATMRVRFSTPLLPELIGLEVGDPVSLNYPDYSINQDFQIIQKTIRGDRIDWLLMNRPY